MNRAANPDTRPSPAYHPPLPLNTSALRNKSTQDNRKITPHNGTVLKSSLASPLTPSSSTSATTRGAPWVRSRAATTTHASTAASYKDDFSCYTPISPLPSILPPTSTSSHSVVADNSSSSNNSSSSSIRRDGSSNHLFVTGSSHTSSKRSRSKTSGASFTPIPSSSPLSPLTFTFDDVWTTDTTTASKTSAVATPVIDTASTILQKGRFVDRQQQPHHPRLETTTSGVASHRYASILPSPRHRTQSNATLQHQLPSPLSSPLDHQNYNNNNFSYVPPLPAPIPQYQRGEHSRQPTTASSFLSFSRLTQPHQQPQQGLASFLEEFLEESDELGTSSFENKPQKDVDNDDNEGSKNEGGITGGRKIRARTTSLHYKLFPHNTLPTMHSNLPSITTPAGTGAGTGAMGPSIDGKVVDWLQEAMQTVTMLESRLQELEEDCKAIPLYEQDRLEMVQVIQELDTMVQQDQEWIGHAETAIQWTSYVLENALISSNTKSQEPIATLRTRIRNFSEEEKNGDADASAVVPGLERNTRSEGMLPSLVPTQSDRTLELVSPPLEPAIGMGLGSGSGSGQCLLESNVNLSYPAPSHSSPSATLSAVGDGRNGSSDGKQMEQKWGSFVDETHIPSREEPLAGISESQEARYRSAIMVALRHLKNIDLAYPSRVSSSDDGSKTMSSKERGSNVADEQETKDKEGAKGNTRTRTKTRGAPPDRALKEWLDNSSMMSLASNVIKEDKEDQEEEESGRELLSVSCVLAAVEETGATRSTDEHMQSTMSERQSPSSRTHMRHRRHLLVGSLSPIDKDVSSFPVTVPNPDILPSSSSTSIETLNHALSTASINATISGSSQSLQTNLGHTLMDERVYLKQHIQYLDRLRNQELSRHQRIEQGHRQLIADLGRFSKELLGSVNELTCAQAAINEASELALLTLSTFEKGASVVDSGLEGGGVADVTATRQQQEQEPSEGVSTTNGTSTAISTKKTNVDANTVTRQKRLIAASRKELESSGGLAGECIKRIRHLAADCVGITELASQRQQPTINLTATNAAASSAGMTTGGTSGNGGGSALQRYAFANMAMSPSDSKAMVKEVGPTFRATATATTSITGTSAQVHPVQAGSIHVEESTLPSSSVFVDGIAFQEFEAHLASVRSSSMSEVGVISESTIFKRAFPSAPSSSSSSARLNSVNNKMNNRRSNTTQNSGPSAFMKKVLVEDIYPCLLIHNGRPGTTTNTTATVTRQNHGWMSSFFSSSSTTCQASTSLPSLSFGTNSNLSIVQGQWLQKLLNAMEANACEIEAWKPTTATNTTVTVESKNSFVVGRTLPPKATCCLCGTIRPCEFRLRLLDHSSSTLTPTPASTPLAQQSQQQQQQQQQHHALDRFCRDRIVAVCDFFMFLAHLRQGLLDQPSSLELFRRALGLRQRMALARIGSVDLLLQNCSVEASAVTRE